MSGTQGLAADRTLLPSSVLPRSGLGDMPLLTGMTCLGLYLLAALNLADVRSDEASTRLAVDVQVLAKLAIMGLLACCGGWLCLTSAAVRSLIGTLPLGWLAVVVLLFLLTGLAAANPQAACVSGGSMLVCLISVAALAARVGPLRVVWVLFLGQATFVAGSWFCFLFLPEVGVFHEPIGDGQTLARMSGLAHPNTLGLFSGLTILVGWALWTERRRQTPSLPRRWLGCDGLVMLIVLMACGALAASLSRTAILALLVAALFASRHWWLRGTGLHVALGLALVGLIAVSIMAARGDLAHQSPHRLGRLIAKTDDAEELTSLTGRRVIWAFTWALIRERPLQGYGAASSKELLQDHMSYAHNMFLHVGLSAGLIAMSVLGAAVLWYVGAMGADPRPLPDAVFVLLMVNGLTENVGFEYIAAAPTAWLVLVMAWRPAQRLHEPTTAGTAC